MKGGDKMEEKDPGRMVEKVHRQTKQVKVLVDANVANAFKDICEASGISMASEISRFMTKRCGWQMPGKTPDPVETRQKRRKAVDNLIRYAARILDAETGYMANIPDNLQGSIRYENSEHSVETLQAVIEALQDTYE